MPSIPIKLVAAGTRLRPADEAQVAALVASIRDVGVLNPITVFPRKVICDHIAEDGYGLIAGLHRLTACRELGLSEIPAHVVTLGELERQIAECDENLCGPKLSPAEKAMFTRRRKEAYLALHPETAKGAAQAAGMNRAVGNDVTDNLSMTFDRDQAAKTGVDARTVRRDAERGEKIDDEVLAKITGTHLDSGAYMDSIKKLSAVEQRARVNTDLDAKKREEDRSMKSSRDESEAKVAAEWLLNLVGRGNLPSLIITLESIPVSKLCAALRRA